MIVTEDVVVRLKQLDMDTIHIKLKGKGRIDVCTPGLGALSVMRDIARFGMMIGRIEEVTPIPINGTGRKETEEVENYIYLVSFHIIIMESFLSKRNFIFRFLVNRSFVLLFNLKRISLD
jgi:hypothetical protein